MAVNNWIDYSRAPIQESPFENLFENVLKGYKMGQEPGKMKDEQKQRQLANQLKSLEVEHKPKEYELGDKQKTLANALQSKALEHYEEKFGLDRDLKKAQIDKAKRAGMAAGLSPSGDVKNAEFIYQLKQSGADPKHIEVLEKAFDAGMKHTEAVTNRSIDITSGTGFDKLPVDEKKRAVGLTTAMGIDPVEGTQLLRSGKTIEQIAKDKGQDLGDLVPIYPLGAENVKQLQKRSGYVAELKNLEQKVARPLSKYPAKVRGYSLDQIADSLDNKNPDAMGQVLAARALSPEIAALRLKVAGGNIGIEAINELTNKSMQQMNVIEGLVDTPTYLATQKYITQWLEEAADSFQKNQEEYGRLKGRSNQNESGIKVYNPATGRLE